MTDQPAFRVEVVTERPWLELSYRFQVVGPHGESWGHHRSEEQARLAAEALNRQAAAST